MGRPNTSIIERHYFEQFRAHGEMPPGTVRYGDKPDVVVAHEGRTTGIEIARLYLADGSNPSSEQVQARRREQVLKRAQSLFVAAGGRALELHVEFDSSNPIVDVKQVAASLANLASAVAHQPDRLHSVAGPDSALRSVFHNGIDYADAKWRSAQVYKVPSLNLSRLEALVAEKALKLSGYGACDAYWLLLVIDFMDRAQDQQVELPAEYRLPASRFEQVFIFKPQFMQVVAVPQRA